MTLHSLPRQGAAPQGFTNIPEADHRPIVNKICQGPLSVSEFMGTHAQGRAIRPAPCDASLGIPVWDMAIVEKEIEDLDVCSHSTTLFEKSKSPTMCEPGVS